MYETTNLRFCVKQREMKDNFGSVKEEEHSMLKNRYQ